MERVRRIKIKVPEPQHRQRASGKRVKLWWGSTPHLTLQGQVMGHNQQLRDDKRQLGHGRKSLGVLGRAGLVGPGRAAHPGTGAPLPRSPNSMSRSLESLPHLPFPLLQTHLRHHSSARPHPSEGVGHWAQEPLQRS